MAKSTETQTKVSITSKIHDFLHNSRKILLIGIPALALTVAVIIAVFAIQDRNQKEAIRQTLSYELALDEALANDDAAKIQEIKEGLESIVGKNIKWASAKSALMLSQIYERNKDWTNATNILLSVSFKKAGYMAPVILFNAATYAEDSGAIDTALEILIDCDTRFSATFPEAPRVKFAIARLYENNKNNQAAIDMYRNLAEQWPQDAYGMLAQSRLLVLDASSLQ